MTEDDEKKARNQLAVRQWVAERYERRKYGERIDAKVTQTLDVGSTLAEVRAQMLAQVEWQRLWDRIRGRRAK